MDGCGTPSIFQSPTMNGRPPRRGCWKSWPRTGRREARPAQRDLRGPLPRIASARTDGLPPRKAETAAPGWGRTVALYPNLHTPIGQCHFPQCFCLLFQYTPYFPTEPTKCGGLTVRFSAVAPFISGGAKTMVRLSAGMSRQHPLPSQEKPKCCRLSDSSI